mgnify:CR=1 FL=1
MEIKKICCIGAGFVGGPTMAVFAKYCPDIEITLVDINKEKIKAWNNDNSAHFPVFERGLGELIIQNRGKNLFFSTDIENSIKFADMIFISVNTPTKLSGLGAGYASDLKWVEESARQVAKFSSSHTIVVEKSTVPVRTAELIKTILTNSENLEKKNKSYSIISSPEFLAEGTAISDLENPDRVLIGGDDLEACKILSGIYERWIPKHKILFTNLWSSELSKLTANAFLAQRVSSINSISALCEVTGAEIREVSNVVGSDTRIGNKFLSVSPGFGGSCFQKDILNLVYLCNFYGLNEVAQYWEQVLLLNNWQRKRISKIIVNNFFGTITSKKIVLLGFAFKPDTNDTRESPSIFVAKDLLENGAKIIIHDPKVTQIKINEVLSIESDNHLVLEKNIFKAVKGADAVVLMTQWDEYLDLDWSKVCQLLRKPAWVFDTRSILESEIFEKNKVNFWRIGNGS